MAPVMRRLQRRDARLQCLCRSSLGVKVTLALSKKSIEFFKSEAAKHHTQYQRMIRRLLDAYVDAQASSAQAKKRPDKRPAP